MTKLYLISSVLIGFLLLSNNASAYSSTDGDSLKLSKQKKADIVFGFFPNPAKDKIFVETNYTEEPCQIYITDVVGNIILEKICEKKKNEIILDDLSSGIYYLTITQAGKSFNRRLIIEK
jgi:hypothetical protein